MSTEMDKDEQKILKAMLVGIHSLFVKHLEARVKIEPETENDRLSSKDLIGEITFDGAMVGYMKVRFPEKAARGIIGKYTGLDPVPDEIYRDACGELVNVIVGRAKSSLGGEYIKITPPSIHDGPAEIGPLTSGHRFACESNFGTIWVDFEARTAGRRAA